MADASFTIVSCKSIPPPPACVELSPGRGLRRMPDRKPRRPLREKPYTVSTLLASLNSLAKPEMDVMAARSSWRSISLSYSTVTSPPTICSRAKFLSSPMSFPAGTALVRSRLAPSGVVSLPVPWKFRPVRGF